MSRRMSCSMTIDAVRSRTKTVTRRHVDTWTRLQAGDRLTLIEKGMGLAKGEHQVVLAEVEITAVTVERLSDLTLADVALEGFGPGSALGGRDGWTVVDFQRFWLGGHGYHADTDLRHVWCLRIEWRYL